MRYEWLDERLDEIVHRYESGQSIKEIADGFGVSTSPIHRRLQDHDVAMRNGGPRYTRLADRTTEFGQAYDEDGRSLQSVADQYETSVEAVRFHLNRAGHDPEELDPKTTAVGFSPFQVSVVRGELLGDGCLYRRDSGRCFFQLSTTTQSHAQRLIEKLPDGLFPPSQPNSVTRENQFTEEDYTCWTVTSRTQPRFERMYEEWYEVRTENNRKIVPEDFTLDDTALLHWYWGDGSCSIRERGAPRVCFATQGFPESSVRHLQSEVDRLGYDNYAVEQQNVDDGSGLFIRLRDYDAREFLDDFRRLNALPAYDHKFPVPLREEE
jgi:predicted DNA-binding protein YlxM (UPF0122 family)